MPWERSCDVDKSNARYKVYAIKMYVISLTLSFFFSYSTRFSNYLSFTAPVISLYYFLYIIQYNFATLTGTVKRLI